MLSRLEYCRRFMKSPPSLPRSTAQPLMTAHYNSDLDSLNSLENDHKLARIKHNVVSVGEKARGSPTSGMEGERVRKGVDEGNISEFFSQLTM